MRIPRSSANRERSYAAQRSRLSLDSDAGAVEAAAGYPRDGIYGIPLLRRERAELDRRSEAGSVVGAIEAFLEPLGLFGGIWINDDRPVGLTVVLAGELSAAEYERLAALAGDYPLTFIRSDVTYAALRDLASKVGAFGRTRSGCIVRIGPNMKTGVVDVGVTADAPADIESQLRAEFGPLIRVIPGSRPAVAV